MDRPSLEILGDSSLGGNDEWIKQLKSENVLRYLEDDQLQRNSETVEAWLRDLVVLLLFSVFEAEVRELIERQLKLEVVKLRHPTLVRAGKDVLDAVAEGSFFRVLESFKVSATHDLIEQVNQVRRYRNWVAHGRRADRKPGVEVNPRDAYERLSEFLRVIMVRQPEPFDPATEGDMPAAPSPPDSESE